MTESFTEWRVTGEPGPGFPSYDFTWSRYRNPHLGGDAEASARAFIALLRDNDHRPWADGPYLHRRTVTVTDWELVEP